MPFALALNPGSNSLKFELVELGERVGSAADLSQRASASIDDIGKQPHLSVFDGRTLRGKQACSAANMGEAVRAALTFLRADEHLAQGLRELAFAVVRVVHGGDRFDRPVEVDAGVRRAIREFAELAPLHNQSSLDALEVLDADLPDTRVMAAFDTAFHRTLPEIAWRYPIERETADRFRIRKFGFHGLSHRYMLERFAALTGKALEECTLVTTHLESGSSACAIRNGQSVDTTMGLTPLEGLMMGSRCGSIDPAIVPYLAEKLRVSAAEVLTLLEKRSGLLGVAGGSLDTRELVKRDDRWAKLALEMYGYRVRLAVGAYLAALGPECQAVILGGGIGEDSPWLRKAVCDGLGGWGLALDEGVNETAVEGEARISTTNARLQAWAMPVEEGLQAVWECTRALQAGDEG